MSFLRFIDERRHITYAIILGVWALVLIFAILQDQLIVRIAPEQLYHKPLWRVHTAEGLALSHAFRASFAPGMLFGIACALVGRHGARPKAPLRVIFTGTLLVLVATTLLSTASGWWVYLDEAPLYPRTWYPDDSLGVITSRTIRISSYLTAPLFSLIFLAIMFRKRSSAQQSPPH